MQHFRLRAFSLLEMSVVLTIIALLVGGVLTAQSYISNAKLAGLMVESKYYIAAWNQFQEKYNTIPGDMGTAADIWPSATNGDGSGQLTNAARALKTTTLGPLYIPEVLYTFQHLGLSGMIDGGYSGASPVDVDGLFIVSPGVNVPKSTWEGAIYLFDHPNAADGDLSADNMYYDGFYGHVLYIGGRGAPAIGMPNQPILSPEQAYSLDTKYDDGKPGTGNVLAPKNTYFSPSACTDSAVAATAAYDSASGTQKRCILFLKIQ